MKKKNSFFLFALFFTFHSFAQTFDKYGFNIGTTISSLKSKEDNSKMGYKTGFCVYASSEMKINTVLSYKLEIGYNQKTYKYNIFPFNKEDFLYHEVGLIDELKFKPFHSKWSPYASIGGSFDFVISSKSSQPDISSGSLQYFYLPNYSELLGIGIELNNVCYLELKHNIAQKKNILGPFDVMLNYWIIKLGVNINKRKKG
jgi:hypothetical protein